MITRKTLLLSSFIGLPVEIIRSSQRGLEGSRGIIIDETKNMILIEKEDKRALRVQKASCVFRFTCQDKTSVDIDGKDICFRPHERPKKV